MSPGNIEQLIPGLAELRAQERQNRALAFAGLSATVCGREVMPLTPRHRLELQLLRNAFTVVGVDPMPGDVFQFLWLLRPGGHATPPALTLALRFKQWQLRRHVRWLILPRAIEEIYRYLIDQLQDSPEASAETGTDQRAWVHWMADDAGFWLSIHGGFTLQSYLETPYLVLQQLYRAWRCNHPDISRGDDGSISMDEPQFINRSDQLISQWHRQHRREIIEQILKNRERRN